MTRIIVLLLFALQAKGQFSIFHGKKDTLMDLRYPESYAILGDLKQLDIKQKMKALRGIKRYLNDTTSQMSTFLIDVGYEGFSDVDFRSYKIQKRMAALYIMCKVFYSENTEAYLLNKPILYDYENKQIVHPESEIFQSTIDRVKRWLKKPKIPFPLTVGKIFWVQKKTLNEIHNRRTRY